PITNSKTRRKTMPEENSIYIVLIIVLITWLGIATSLFGIDRKLKKIEKKISEINKNENI
ncbi:MAG TPA: CcmD family protein, partial [Candidatus Kapabacteria bacterium]|nr:CcmD family protein [Candidatus Kapabacteria bacterium]